MKANVDPRFFPLTQLPFDTYCKLLDECRGLCTIFVPTNMKEDLTTGKTNRLIYWYPSYVDTLFDLAANGLPYKEWLNQFNELNSFSFQLIFPTTVEKLDKLIMNKIKIKHNHLDEMKVKIN